MIVELFPQRLLHRTMERTQQPARFDMMLMTQHAFLRNSTRLNNTITKIVWAFTFAWQGQQLTSPLNVRNYVNSSKDASGSMIAIERLSMRVE